MTEGLFCGIARTLIFLGEKFSETQTYYPKNDANNCGRFEKIGDNQLEVVVSPADICLYIWYHQIFGDNVISI